MRAVAGVTIACLCGHQALIILSPVAIQAYVSGGRFAPNVPLPPGWTAFVCGEESAFECPSCSSKHEDLLKEARVGMGVRNA